MSKFRKTYYRIVDSQIQKVRRIVPPDPSQGWDCDRKKLELQLQAKQTPITKIDKIKRTIGFDKKTDSSDESLLQELEKQKQQVKALKAELTVLKRRTETDKTLCERIKEERKEKELLELHRVAEFARYNKGISEEEYYRVKNIAQGLEQRLKAFEERYEALQSTYQTECSKSSTLRIKAKQANKLINLLYTALKQLNQAGDVVITNLPPSEQGDHRRKFNIVFNKCENAIIRAKWEPQQDALCDF